MNFIFILSYVGLTFSCVGLSLLGMMVYPFSCACASLSLFMLVLHFLHSVPFTIKACAVLSGDRDEETELVDLENFKAYDEDKDGKLNQAEVKNWVIPDYEAAANDEADHLIEHSDLDGDKKLVRQEILDKYELWVGSSATDYGRTLHEEL